MMSLFDSSPVTPRVLPADQPTLDQAQLAAAAFLARYGGTLESYRTDLRQFFQWADDVGGVVVHVAGLDDIIAAKEHADRDKDRQALPELRRLRDHLPGTD